MAKIKTCPKCNYPLLCSSREVKKEEWVKTWRCVRCGYIETSTQKGRIKYELTCPVCGGISIAYQDFYCDGTELKVNLRCEDCSTFYVMDIPWD